jgi:hypothetical protein
MQTKKSEIELTQEIIAKLAAEGVHAYVEVRTIDEDGDECEPEDILRVPAWETDDQSLCRKAVYTFIHSKLAAAPGKGFAGMFPGLPYAEVYCYNPVALDAGKELGCWDVRVSGASDYLEDFAWENVVEGDDCAWCEGWDHPSEMDYVSRRVATLAILLNHSLVELPPIEPYTESELIAEIQKQQGIGWLYCVSGDHKDRWSLRLSATGSLVLHKQSDNSETPITAENFAGRRGLVLGSQTLMHRSWGF